MTLLLGSHVSTQGGFSRAVQRAVDVDCDCLQVFVSPPRQWPVKRLDEAGDGYKPVRRLTKNNNQWAAKPLTAEAISRWKEAFAASGLQGPIAHASYLINLASPDDALFQKSIDALVVELERANALELEGLVVHPGAYTTSDEQSGLRRIVDGVTEGLGRVEPGSCRLLLENTAGQGSCLGHQIEQLAAIWDGVDQPERLGICLDTCHAFAAGYEINNPAGLRELTDRLRDQLPAASVRALHLNDSKKPLGSRVDRHEHIGRGEIGLDGFRLVLGDPLFCELPGYLETEKGTDEESGEPWDRVNLRVLRELV